MWVVAGRVVAGRVVAGRVDVLKNGKTPDGKLKLLWLLQKYASLKSLVARTLFILV